MASGNRQEVLGRWWLTVEVRGRVRGESMVARCISRS